MSWNPSPNVTPFIPPLPSPGGGLLVRPPVIPDPPAPNPQTEDLPSWATEQQTAGNFPTMYPGAGSQYTPFVPQTPFTGTPFIPRMEDFNTPAPGPAPQPPGSYFPPPRNLPPQQTPHHGTNGLSADYTGYPSGPQGGPGPQGFGGGGGGLPQGAGAFGGGGQGFGPQGFGGGGGGGPGFGGFGPGGPGTPWPGPPMPGAYPHTPFAHAPMMPPNTGYIPFQHLPGAFGPRPHGDWGPAAGYGPQQYTPAYGMTGMPGGMGHTPWHAGGGLPPGGPQRQGMGERMGAKLSEQWHRSDGWDLHDHDKIRFTSGPHCVYLYVRDDKLTESLF